MAASENDQRKSSEYFDKVKRQLNFTDKIRLSDQLSFALKGYLQFYQGDFNIASNYFTHCQSLNPTYVIAILGLGNLEFARGNFQNALEQYKKAIKFNKDLPAQARFGLAMSFYCLEKYDLANAAFDRILQLDNQNIDALIGKAIIQFRKQNYEKYYDLIEKCYKINKYHPNLLLNIAEKFLLGQSYENAKKISYLGLKELKTKNKFIIKKSQQNEKNLFKIDYYQMKSKFLFILGFINHKENNQSQALKLYKESLLSYPQNLQAQFNLAQIYIQEKQYSLALQCLETIKENSQDGKYEEIYKYLAYLYNKNQKRKESIYFYQKAMEYDPEDFDILIEYGGIQEYFDIQESLNSYEKAIQILKSRQQHDETVEIQPELYNNLGVLKMKQQKYKEAHKHFMFAFNENERFIKQKKDNIKYLSIKNTIKFNLGNLLEEMNQIGEAYGLYKQIIQDNQFYVDAYLRLAYLNFKRNSFKNSIDLIDNALKKNDQSKLKQPDLPLCLKGFIQWEFGEKDSAIRTFESLRTKFHLDDQFALLFLAKIEYEQSSLLRNKHKEQKQSLRKVCDIAKGVLSHDENSFQAALIIGVVFAEMGYFRESKEIFNQLQDMKQQNSTIMVNLAHLEFLQKNYENAIRIYQSYLEKDQSKDENVEIQISICYALQNKYDEAIRIMKKIILRNPENILNRYNFNYLLNKQSMYLLNDQKIRERDKTQRAIKILNKIQNFYQHLFYNKSAINSRMFYQKYLSPQLIEFIKDESENKYNYISTNKERFDQLLIEDEKKIQLKQKSKFDRKKELQEIKAKELEMKKKEELQKLKEQEEKERKAQETMEEAKQLAEQFAGIYQEKREKKSRKKKQRTEIEDQFIQQDDENEYMNYSEKDNDENDNMIDQEQLSENLFDELGDDEKLYKELIGDQHSSKPDNLAQKRKFKAEDDTKNQDNQVKKKRKLIKFKKRSSEEENSPEIQNLDNTYDPFLNLSQNEDKDNSKDDFEKPYDINQNYEEEEDDKKQIQENQQENEDNANQNDKKDQEKKEYKINSDFDEEELFLE